MSTKPTLQNNKAFLVLFFLLFTLIGNAQIGIGTITPDASSVLDITSTTKGMLAPRMTTAQRIAITTPADGLVVYDTDLKLLHYFSATGGWLPIVSGTPGRINFKRIKSTDNLAVVLSTELANGGGNKYQLLSNTLYEINGQVTFNFPIDLNNAYVQGLDANDDIILRPTGNLFEGANGGSIRGVTLSAPGTGGNVFNLSGAATQNLIFRDCIVANSANVGTISGFGLVFLSIIQFTGNKNGIVYNNITQLLLSNLGWFSNNLLVYEKLTGTFTLVEKQGGFSQVVDASAVGFDVSSNPSITGDAVLESVVFTGANTANYVKPYTSGTYTGYNFNNSWNVRSAGIPTESDASAVGDFAVDYGIGNGLSTTLTGTNPSNTVKVPGVTSSYNLFRFSTDSGVSNRLKYLGKKKRIFQISGSITSQSNNTGIYAISIGKNGIALAQYKIYARLNGSLLGGTDVIVVPINAVVELSNNDYIEVWIQRTSGSGDVTIANMALNIK